MPCAGFKPDWCYANRRAGTLAADAWAVGALHGLRLVSRTLRRLQARVGGLGGARGKGGGARVRGKLKSIGCAGAFNVSGGEDALTAGARGKVGPHQFRMMTLVCGVGHASVRARQGGRLVLQWLRIGALPVPTRPPFPASHSLTLT